MWDKENHENRQISFLVDENPSKPLKMLWTIKSTNQQGRLAWDFKRKLMVLGFFRSSKVWGFDSQKTHKTLKTT